MTHVYYVRGMHCASCAEKIEKALKALPQISSAKVDVNTKQLTVQMNKHVELDKLNDALKTSGEYTLSEQALTQVAPDEGIKKFLPLIAIFFLIVLFTVFQQWRNGPNVFNAMHDFMGAFFLVFGGFKVANWKGFVESYRTYDIVARKSEVYAYLYPLIEIGLGLAYLFHINLFVTNLITLIVMGISTIGVAQALMAKKKIVCACLGAVFKIPMTKVTLLEDVLMFLMALAMLVLYGV